MNALRAGGGGLDSDVGAEDAGAVSQSPAPGLASTWHDAGSAGAQWPQSAHSLSPYSNITTQFHIQCIVELTARMFKYRPSSCMLCMSTSILLQPFLCCNGLFCGDHSTSIRA